MATSGESARQTSRSTEQPLCPHCGGTGKKPCEKCRNLGYRKPEAGDRELKLVRYDCSCEGKPDCNRCSGFGQLIGKMVKCDCRDQTKASCIKPPCKYCNGGGFGCNNCNSSGLRDIGEEVWMYAPTPCICESKGCRVCHWLGYYTQKQLTTKKVLCGCHCVGEHRYMYL